MLASHHPVNRPKPCPDVQPAADIVQIRSSAISGKEDRIDVIYLANHVNPEPLNSDSLLSVGIS